MVFSVVVPVYNVENYLKECIDGVIGQDFTDYEIVLVNDGSTDSSPQICDEYKEQYNFINVIHKQNGGLSEARNVGLDNASGDYIVFLDSDDFWHDSTFLSKVYTILNNSNSDIVVFGYQKVLDETIISVHKPSSTSKTVDKLIVDGDFNICAWDKVVKRSILVENNITFRKGVYSEDMEWCARLYQAVSSVEVLCETPHSYRQRAGSITKRIKEKNISDVMNNFEECLKIRNVLSTEKASAFDYFLAKNISMFMIALSQIDSKLQKTYYPFVKQNINFLRCSSRRREKIIYVVAKTLGVSFSERLLSLAYRVKG